MRENIIYYQQQQAKTRRTIATSIGQMKKKHNYSNKWINKSIRLTAVAAMAVICLVATSAVNTHIEKNKIQIETDCLC